MRNWNFSALMVGLACYQQVLGVAVSHVAERRDGNSITKPFQRRALHSVAVIGDYLYIEGGETSSFIDGQMTGKNPSNTLNRTLSVNLGQSFSLAGIKYNEIQDHKPPPVNKLSLWSDSKSGVFYRYGGAVGWGVDLDLNGDINQALWKFTPDNQGSGTWSTETPANKDVFDSLTQNTRAAAAFCPNEQLGFVVGGFGTSSTDKRFKGVDWPRVMNTPGMLKYDASTKTWSNESTTAMSANGVFTAGEALCASGVTNNSLLFVFGGYTSSTNDFTNITFYDTKTSTWHSQSTTGEIPKSRELFCAVGVNGRNGTYEIFIHGGRNKADGSLNDTYILTIPGFNWFKVGVTAATRIDHTCTVIGKRQMLISGGIQVEWDWKPSDPWVTAVGVLDMTALQWSDGYDAKAAEYDSPQPVQAWYNKGGLASVSWSSPAVKNMFSTIQKAPSPSPTGLAPTQSPSESPSGSSTPVGAIAGGAVGGVAAIALLGIVAFLWRRKAQRKNTHGQETRDNIDQNGYTENKYVGAELHAQTKPQELPSKQVGGGMYEMPG